MAQTNGLKFNDCEEIRYEDRIKALAWKEALDAGATFITKKWGGEHNCVTPGILVVGVPVCQYKEIP